MAVRYTRQDRQAFRARCLVDAIAIVNQPVDVDAPSEHERRDPVELDQDKVGVVGHPSLAGAIFKKIAAASSRSSTAMRWGKLTDDATLLVMNLHYGPLTKLPFDLGHKVAPCRYRLAPDASVADITKAKKALTGQFGDALKLHIKRVASLTPEPKFREIESPAVRRCFGNREKCWPSSAHQTLWASQTAERMIL